MNNIKLKKLTHKILQADERLWNEDKSELNQALLLELIEIIDETVIDLLLQEKDLRDKFFVKIKDAYVFKNNEFRFFIEENKIDNSYTAYKNRIGLTDGKKFLKDTNDVVLDFPYKDCVLEGGQSTEEGIDIYFEFDETVSKAQEKQGLIADGYNKKTAKRNEIFFNSILAQDEIDRLFDSKALTNWKRYTKKGEQKVKEIERGEDGTIKENLIIKGNNLIALQALDKQFTGKVKLIYIDPPFNTGKDEFKYNDNFSHSTWLTFMKNRLEIAKKLLRNDGVISVHTGNEEASYIQVLLDEVFGRHNYLNHIAMSTNAPSGFKATSAKIFSTANHIYLYAKNIGQGQLNKIYVKKEYDSAYKFYLLNPNEHYSKWKYCNVIEFLAKEEGCNNTKQFKNKYGTSEVAKKISDFASKNKDRVFRTAAIGGGALKKRKKTIQESKMNKGRVMQHPNEDVEGFYILNGEGIVFWSNNFKEIDGEIVPATSLTDIWTDIGFTGIANEGGVTLKNGKKPELLLKRILELATKEGDIVLDYHLGSGTTCAVAHKMKRQYIGIEQLEYGENDSTVRMQNVINGDQSGVSKLVNWKDGKDLVICELAKWNQTAKEKLINCNKLDELVKYFDEMYEKYFLNYNLKIKEFREKVINEETFKNLNLKEQKKMFITMLDNNQLYVNKSEMADKIFGISKEDQDLTSLFYSAKK